MFFDVAEISQAVNKGVGVLWLCSLKLFFELGDRPKIYTARVCGEILSNRFCLITNKAKNRSSGF